MKAIQLRRISHVGLRVADLEEASRRWQIQFGLSLRERTSTHAFLHCGYESYSLELMESGNPGYDHTAYELSAEVSISDAAEYLESKAIAYQTENGSLHLQDAEGNKVEIVPYAASSDLRPDVARSTKILPGFRPRKLGHVNYLTGKLREQVEFYTDILGMKITDKLGTEGIWLHINADHHVMALVNKGYPHIHHFALEMVDWGELRVAFDHLAQHGRWLAWGPLRHGLGRNLSGYVRIPEEGCFVEIFCDMEQLEEGHVPREWPDNAHSSNVWGILPPRSYFRFDEAAIRSEKEGLEAQGIPLAPLEVSK
ncbi:VOC family protein [Ferviditalea candida]|uniref:VOC family protein n=1 Tax=Ferviditalea candida TaxID=3108399 RepID=A0ABU5ZMD8_9BACL|nr:VOC family protein [Paenibacillaceae bacterium T2]